RTAGVDRPAGLPARTDGGAGRDRGTPGRRLARGAQRRRGLPGVLRPDERRGAGDPGRQGAGTCEREGGGMIDLIDDLEAGELSIEFEGREPWELLEWAL